MSDKVKPGRKPIGDKAMTAAERKRMQRARQKATQKQDVYLVMSQSDLQEFSALAEAYSTTRTEIMGGILGGALKQLKQLDEVLQQIVETRPDQVELYKHQALRLMCEGGSLEHLLIKIASDLSDEL